MRAVIVSPTADILGLARLVAEVTATGAELVGVVDSADHVQAHAMVAGGVADVIVARPEHLVSVATPSQLAPVNPYVRAGSGDTDPANRRPRPIAS